MSTAACSISPCASSKKRWLRDRPHMRFVVGPQGLYYRVCEDHYRKLVQGQQMVPVSA